MPGGILTAAVRHVVGQPDGVGGQVESVAACLAAGSTVRMRGLAGCAHQGRARRGGY
jgi:hypothetical protein